MNKLWLFSKKRKVILFGVCLIGLVVIFALTKKGPMFEAQPTLLPPPTPSYPAVLEKTLNYIQSQYRTDGYYDYYPDYEKFCPPEKNKEECPFGGAQMFETTNAWTALAYLAAYKVEKKPEYLDYAKRDLDRLMEYCQKDPRECLWVLVQFVEAYKVTGEQRYLSFLKDEGEVLLTFSDLNAMLKGIEVRELALIGELTGEERFFSEAETRLTEARALTTTSKFLFYTVNPSNERTYVYPHTCWNILAGIELYKRPGKEKGLGEIEDFLEKIRMTKTFGGFLSPPDIQPCIEGKFILDGGEGKQLLDLFIDRFWQEAVFPYQKEQRKEIEMKVLTDSCYLVHLLGKAGQ